MMDPHQHEAGYHDPNHKPEPKTEKFSRSDNRRMGQRGKRFAPAQAPSSQVAASYMLGGLGGTPSQRLGFFGQMGRKETLRKGLARLSTRMARRARRRSVEHMKFLTIAAEFERGRQRLS
jgi:hypothetical protein